MAKLLFVCAALAAVFVFLGSASIKAAELPSPRQSPIIASIDTTAALPLPEAPQCVSVSSLDREQCYHRSPATRRTVEQTVTVGPSSASKHSKHSKKSAKSSKASKKKSKHIVLGMCQPQCIPYTRCRSGVDTCRLGNTSPVQWYMCEHKSGRTQALPEPGSVLVLAANARRGMPTGHTLYVEEVCTDGDGTYTLRLSHTNFDRACSADIDAKVRYDPRTMRTEFLTGPWAPWAKSLTALGFIVD